MKTSNPLELVARIGHKTAELFRSLSHPGWALFGEVAAEAAGEAQVIAHEAEQDDRAATADLDEILRDGIVTPEELPLLRRARGRVALSAAKDAKLAGGAA
jgi:hypothetical protein